MRRSGEEKDVGKEKRELRELPKKTFVGLAVNGTLYGLSRNMYEVRQIKLHFKTKYVC